MCWTITWNWLVLGSGFGQKVAGSGWSSLGKTGESGFIVEILPAIPIHYSSFSDYVCHSSCKYSSSALSTLSLISYPFIFSPFLYSLSFCSYYLQKFTRKFHFSITLLVFSLYTYSLLLSVLQSPASPISLTVKKWRFGLSQTQGCSIYTVQLRVVSSAFRASGLLDPWREGLIYPLSPLPSTARPTGPPSHVPTHYPNSWPHAAGMKWWSGWKDGQEGGAGRESHLTSMYCMKIYGTNSQNGVCCSLTFVHTWKQVNLCLWKRP